MFDLDERTLAKRSNAGMTSGKSCEGSSCFAAIDARHDWLRWWRAEQKAMAEGDGIQPLINISLLDLNATLLPRLDRYNASFELDAASITVVRRLPMVGRPHFESLGHTSLAAAAVTIGQQEAMLVVEWMQPFDFRREDEGMLSFVTPNWNEVRNDSASAAGYATVSVSAAVEMSVEAQQTLYYTEDCPSPGMFGKGIDCRHSVCLVVE